MNKFYGLHKNCYKVYAERFVKIKNNNVKIVLLQSRTIFYFEYDIYDFHKNQEPKYLSKEWKEDIKKNILSEIQKYRDN